MLLRSRRMLIFLCFMLLIASLASCNTDQPNDQAAGSVAEHDPIRLVMWGGVPPEAGPAEVMERWNREHPDIQIEYVRYVNDDDGNMKLDTALLTGQKVDLYMSYTFSQLERRVEAGAALDLSHFADYDPDAMLGEDAVGWKVKQKYYGLPTKKSVFFVALNKEALEQAGLAVPKDWTWDELRMYAKRLIETGQFKYGFLQHLETFTDPIDSILAYAEALDDKGHFNMDHPLIAEWLSTLKAMMEQDHSTPGYGEQLTSKMPVEQMFLDEETAMLNIGEWLLRSANNKSGKHFTIAFAPVPRMVEQDEYMTRGGLGDVLSIHPSSAHIEAAWEFLKWYIDEGMIPMAAGGRLPASKAANMEQAMKAFLGDQTDRYDMESLEYVLYEDPTPTYVRSVPQALMDIRVEEYERFFLGTQTLEKTLEQMKLRLEALIKP